MKPRQVVPLSLALALGTLTALVTPTVANPPSTYNAITSTAVIPIPSVTNGGALDMEGTISGSTWTPKVAGHGAGYVFTPTDFYCPMVRVTDPNSDPTRFNFSYYGPPTWMAQGWNVNSSYFYIQNSGGASYVYSFNVNTMACAMIGKYNGVTDWDTNNAHWIYGYGGNGTPTAITKWDFSTTPPTITTVVDVASYLTLTTAQISETHPSDGTGHGGSKQLKFSCHTGGTGAQNSDTIVFWWDTATGAGEYYHTDTGYIYNTAGTCLNPSSPITPTFTIHQTATSRDGQYVWIGVGNYITGTTGGPFIWDTTNNTVLPSATGNLSRPGGHHGLGWAEMINADMATTPINNYWWYRKIDSAADMASPVTLVANVPTTMKYYDDHVCWNQAQNGTSSTDWLPCFTSTIQQGGTWYGQNPPYWGDEIIGIATADRSGAGANTVYRFAHNFSTIMNNASQDDYGANAWPNVSQDGNFILFQSNWEDSLGTLQSSTNYRDDVFIVKLTQSAH